MNPEDRMRQLGSRDDAVPTEAEWLEFRERGHRSVRNRRIGAALGSAGLVAAIAFGAYVLTNTSDDKPEIRPAASPTTKEPAPESSPSAPAEEKSQSVVLQQWFVEDEKLTLFHATLDDDGDPVRTALATLLQGVPGPLAESGGSTQIPEGTAIADLTVSGGTAEVTLAGDFPDDSDLQQDLALAQIVYTLTQFDEIEEVALAWESAESGGVGMGPETREKYQDYLPPIVVESPYPGQTIDGKTFTLSGMANVFEATVSWRIVGPDGERVVIDEGFTTATCGTGCWGTFEEKIRYGGEIESVIIEVYESSAEDGSQLWLQEIPLNFKR